MSLGSQFRTLSGKAADFRQAIFGTDSVSVSVSIDYDRGRFTCTGYYTPIKDKQKTENAGFIDDNDAIVRIKKSVFPAGAVPELNKELKIIEGSREIFLTINEILGSHPASVEWLFGCEAKN